VSAEGPQPSDTLPSGILRSGILLVDKPQGPTSHDVVGKVRKLAGTRKVGHAGTLDPMATGLLILGINNATRLLTFMVGEDKEYLATIRLGQATTTDDADGEIISTTDASSLDDEMVTRAVAALTGQIEQIPSSVSAIKVDGKRAYALARAGETVTLTPRAVTVSAFEVREFRPGTNIDLDVRVVCSTGTYIRALARDLGLALGVGGHLTALRRTRVGPFGIAESSPLSTLDVESSLISPGDAAGRLFPVLSLDEEQSVDLGHGRSIAVEGHGTVAAIAPDGRLVGLASLSDGRAAPLVNFPKDGPRP
jgi:tRNA pseudouridine55 synthase